SSVTVLYSFPSAALDQSTTFSNGPSGNGQSSPAIGVPNGNLFYFSYPVSIVIGTDNYVLIGTSHTSPVTATNSALNITGNYELEGSSGGLTVTAPDCAQGGTFSI